MPGSDTVAREKKKSQNHFTNENEPNKKAEYGRLYFLKMSTAIILIPHALPESG